MKNLREEIEKILEEALRYERAAGKIEERLMEGRVPGALPHFTYIDPKGLSKKIVELFRSWALGMVGEETDLLSQGNSPEFVRGYNQAKVEIRERIEEAT